MFLEERRKFIFDYINENERGEVIYFSNILSVSKETIRKDLNYLESIDLVKRCHGGAIIIRKKTTKEIDKNDTGIFNELKKFQDYSLKKDKKGNKMKGKVFVFGSFNIDIVSNVPRFPNVGESIISNGSNIGPGGKGTNQAIAASNSNSEVYFSAKVGDDEFGKIAKDHLNRSNIKNYNLFISDSEATGTAIIYVSQERGDNMIAIYPGANQKITTDEINIIESEIYSSNILLVQLENNIEPIKLLIEKAKKLGVKVVLNPAPYSDEIISHLNNIYLITPNQTEASSLSGINIVDLPTAKQAASEIKNLGVENVIITMGEKGVLILENNIFTHIAAYPAVVVDTTGAGDAFNGAIAASLANGKDLISSARWASAFASLAVEMKGASNMPTFDDVENKIAIQNKGKL